MSPHNKNFHTRSIATLMVAISVCQFGRASGSPSDIFNSAAPVIGADPPKAAELRSGDASVSTQTGALQYSYPIQVPPGRRGMAPSLALSYSSQAPTYGGIATGWSLPLGMIRQDTSHGRIAPGTFARFMVGESRLVEVTEPHASDVSKTYRIANGDTSFTRYEQLITGATARWRARATDGSISLFGEPAFTTGCDNVGDGFAPLTRSIDVFGNEVAYSYESAISKECRIQKITWGQNANAGLTNPFAQVVFTWEAGTLCPNAASYHVGGQHDYRTGKLIKTGSSRLKTIVATAFPPGSPGSPVHTRTVTLGYDVSDEQRCGQSGHAPSRRLTSIQESASGTDSPLVTLPAVTFDYGDSTVDLATASGTSTPWGDPQNPNGQTQNLAWGVRRTGSDDRWPTVEAMMLDIDGDGLLDRVYNNSTPDTTGQCAAQWQRNEGPPSGSTSGLPIFGVSAEIKLPKLKWRGQLQTGYPASGATLAGLNNKEGCALNGQVTAFENSNPGNGCHVPGSSCTSGTDPDNPGPYCLPGGTECSSPSNLPDPFRTYLAYRWLDMDADGLVDLVAAVHGNINAYDIERGNRVGYDAGEPALFGPWPVCPGAEVEKCKDISVQCADAARSCPHGQPCTVNDAALDACVVAAEELGCHDVISAFFLPPGGPAPDPRKPYTRCEGLYPWFIYKNNGNGSFATTPAIKYQPIPLESDAGDSNMSGTRVTSQRHAVMDFDGDGILDAVARPGATSGAPWWWLVWSGDGTGGFAGQRHLFHTRNDSDNAISGTGAIVSGEVVETAGLLDANGDGLSDHWHRNTANNANIAFHLGAKKFDLYGSGQGPIGTLDTPVSPIALVPGNDATKVITLPSPWTPGQPIDSGYTTARSRTVDVDNDGRVDIVQWGTPPKVYFNLGGQFMSPGDNYRTNTGGLQRMTTAANNVPPQWELDGDLIDLDGDGIGESVYFDGTGLKRFVRVVPTDGAPPRLLQAIHNGRGAHALVTYAQMHDTSAVNQAASATWFDGRPKATPRTQWVVKSLKATDDFAGTTSITSYVYNNPRHGADDEGRYAFRGFEEVFTTAPSLMKTVQRYDYENDWSGRLAQTHVVPAEAPSDVRSISKSKWTGRSLFGGLVKTFHPTIVENLTCANGQSEAACLATPVGYTRSDSTLTDFPLIGTKLLVLETGTLLRKQAGTADGDRQTIRTFTMLADATTYKVRPLTALKEHRVAGSMVMFAKSAQEWDPTLAVPLTDETWFDSIDVNRAKSRSVYDMATGNVTERWKPMQNDAGTTRTRFNHDSRKLFVATETNELDHERNYLWEYGTGTKLQTDGPNVRTCTTSCGAGPLKEQTKLRVDGLGRTIELWETFSDLGDTFTSRLKETTSYVDAVVVPTTPASFTHQVRLTTTASPATMVKTEIDGHGRPIQRTEFVQGTAPSDHYTIWNYRDDGTLESVSVQNPQVNTTHTFVTYAYEFDSLGRAKSIRRPDSTTVANKSGIDVTHDGLTKTVTEYVGSFGGTPASTKTITDSIGRLIEVHERTAIAPETFAVTQYAYGPDDTVVLVVDPQSVTTQLVHDYAGRRTQINRHGRSWKYTYDKNGSLKSEQVPGAPLGMEALFTTTVDYDDLDRPVSKVIGQRGLSAPDQALFASGAETLTYDVGGNMTGRLRGWKSFAPGASLPAITRDRLSDDQGFDTRAEHIYSSVAGLSNSVFTTMKHNVGGMLTETKFSEGTAALQTTATIPYSARGFPTQINFAAPGVATKTIGVQTRNIAGLVTRRETVLSPTQSIIAVWNYDKLARVIKQDVTRTGPKLPIVEQNLAYFGNDDPKSLTHILGTSSKEFQFGYDGRHQITSANETTTPGYFTSAYQYGTGGRFTNVNIAQPTPPFGSEVKPRNVDYQYGDADPERVTAIVDAGTLLPYATYQYDAAGNQTSRCYGATVSPCAGESMDFVYDGKDQLRRAVKKQAGVVVGSEEYWYDDTGSRITVLSRNASGTKTGRIQFLGDMEVHFNQSDVKTHANLNLSLGTPIVRVKRTTGSTFEYMFHGLGNHTIAAVSSAGTTNAAFSYTPFGEVLEKVDIGGSSGADLHRRRFNDKYHDLISELGYYGARYFDRTLVGWTQSDPLYRFAPDQAWISPRLALLYTFSLQNPLRYIDPDGKNPIPCLPGRCGSGTPIGYLRDFAEGAVTGLKEGWREHGGIVKAIAGAIPMGRGAQAVVNILGNLLDALSGNSRSSSSPSDGIKAAIEAATNGMNSVGIGDVHVGGRVRIGKDVEINGVDAKPTGGPRERLKGEKGQRMKEGDNLKTAQDQLTGIENAQKKTRGDRTADDGTMLRGADGTISETKKSEENLRNRTDRIKSREDAEIDDDIE